MIFKNVYVRCPGYKTPHLISGEVRCKSKYQW